MPRRDSAGSPRCLVRARVHRAASAEPADRRRDPRRVVCRASRMVPAARRRAAAVADRAVRAAGARGRHGLGVLEARDHRASRDRRREDPRHSAGHRDRWLVQLVPSPSPCVPASPQSLAPSPYRVLYVGSIFNRRHVTDLIRAFAPIARASRRRLARHRRRQPQLPARGPGRHDRSRRPAATGPLARVRLRRSSCATSTPGRGRLRFCPNTKGWA